MNNKNTLDNFKIKAFENELKKNGEKLIDVRQVSSGGQIIEMQMAIEYKDVVLYDRCGFFAEEPTGSIEELRERRDMLVLEYKNNSVNNKFDRGLENDLWVSIVVKYKVITDDWHKVKDIWEEHSQELHKYIKEKCGEYGTEINYRKIYAQCLSDKRPREICENFKKRIN